MAIGMAEKVKDEFGEKLDLEIYKTDSEKAQTYPIMGSTNVFINEEWVPLEIALSDRKLKDFIREKL